MSDRRTKLRWMRDAEARGLVADSTSVRMELMARVHAGEITLAEAQAQLKRLKRTAKSRGLVTQNQAYCGKYSALEVKEGKT